jgi:hypothetical protein
MVDPVEHVSPFDQASSSATWILDHGDPLESRKTKGQDTGDSRRLAQIDHDLQVLWDLRRRELAGEEIDLDEDYFDRFTVDPGTDAPGR